MPAFLSIEPTSFCNLKCPECPTGNRHIHRKPLIEWDLYKKIIEENKNTLCYLTLYFQGEPLLHPDLTKMIRFAHDNYIYTCTSTNAQTIDAEKAMQIVKSGLDKIIVSADGTTQSVYEQYRKGGVLQKAIDAVRFIKNAKESLQSKTPFVELQFIVFRHNEHQMVEFKKEAYYWGADKIVFKTAQIYEYENKSILLPSEKKYCRYELKKGRWRRKKPLRNHCFKLCNSAVITTEGDLLPCCFDKMAQHVFGNICSNTTQSVWHSNAASTFRKAVFSARKDINICNNCTE